MFSFVFLTLMVALTLFPLQLWGNASTIKHPAYNHNLELRHNYGGTLTVKDSGLNVQKAEDLEAEVERVMSMSEEELIALIPLRPTIRWMDCPNCSEGTGDEALQIFDWTIEKPNQITCKYCGHVYPSDKYLMNQCEDITTGNMERFRASYHLDSQGNDYYFEDHIKYRHQWWLVRQAHALAQAYHLTKKPRYARRAALIIDRFAQVFPGYVILYQWPNIRRHYLSFSYNEVIYHGGRWSYCKVWEIPRNLLLAYDLIYESAELDKLSEELNTDIRDRIEKDFFMAIAEYLKEFKTPIPLSNVANDTASGFARLGIILGRPEYVHMAYRWIMEMLSKEYYYDGMWKECAVGYHVHITEGIAGVVDELEGYSDPPNYQDPVDRLHFENLDLRKDIPILKKALSAHEKISYPNGRYCPVHDTLWYKSHDKPLDESACQILPGVGHAVLGCGRDQRQTQVHFHFSGNHGHQHCDNLNLFLFAYGREVICDLGYTRSKMRMWFTSSLAHNLVVINRQNQSYRDHQRKGDLLMYIPNLTGLSAIEASGKQGYPDVADVYKRLTILVSTDENSPYVVDIFHVKGGFVHDWSIHGSANHDQTASCSLNLSSMEGERPMLEEGETFVEPTGQYDQFNYYGLLKNVKKTSSSDNWYADFTYEDNPNLGVRIHMLGGSETEVFLCESPSVRRGREEGSLFVSDSRVYDYYMPQLIARRIGIAPLESIFVSVIEPISGESQITSVERITTEPSDDQFIALEVNRNNGTDTVLIALEDNASFKTERVNSISIKGRIGLISRIGQDVRTAFLVGGTELRSADLELTSPVAFYEGEIEGTIRVETGGTSNAFITATLLPTGTDLRNFWIIVTHGDGTTQGYGIDHVERKDGKTRIHIVDDHGLKIEGNTTEECFFPRRKIKGKNRFCIYTVSMGD